jgi:PRTRC genetic system protein E
MKLLSTISPMLLDESEVILTVTKKGDQLNILVQPKLLNGKPETDDETLANLQVAFQLPMAITVMAEPDPDAALAEALAELGSERKEAVTELVSYREKLQRALGDAKKAEAEKAEKAAAKAAAKPAVGGKKDKPAKTTTKGAKPAKGRAAPETAASALPNAGETPTPPPAPPVPDLFTSTGAPA